MEQLILKLYRDSRRDSEWIVQFHHAIGARAFSRLVLCHLVDQSSDKMIAVYGWSSLQSHGYMQILVFYNQIGEYSNLEVAFKLNITYLLFIYTFKTTVSKLSIYIFATFFVYSARCFLNEY